MAKISVGEVKGVFYRISQVQVVPYMHGVLEVRLAVVLF